MKLRGTANFSVRPAAVRPLFDNMLHLANVSDIKILSLVFEKLYREIRKQRQLCVSAISIYYCLQEITME